MTKGKRVVITGASNWFGALNTAALTVALALAVTGCATMQSNSTKETDMTVKDIALKGYNAILRDFDVDAARAVIAEDYIQHNVGVPTGLAPILGFLPNIKATGLKATIHRVLVEGDLVVTHSTYENAQAFGSETLVALDVWRVKDGKLVEHWDNLQPPPAKTASGRSMTDGTTEIVDRELTAQNKAFVEAFAREVLVGGQFDKVSNYITAEPGAYLQHNPNIADGLDGLGKAFAQFAEAGQAITYKKVHTVVAEGNFVFLMSEGALGETPTAFFDLLRVEDGKIVEHWDTIATIPPASEMAHKNGKF